MVQAIENWADVRGKLVEVSPAASGNFLTAKVRLEQVQPVPGFANLFAEQEGQTIELRIPRDKAQQLPPGAMISARIRRAGPAAAFAHPDYLETT